MKSAEIRRRFFYFFIKRQHEKIASSSLIPAQDPTLLFTNAGMNQFKDVFLGDEKRSYSRAVSIQKCVRAGGKHNDLENVGFTKRHLTFFEMMGNFSFGDYFKKEAIAFAWDFLTKELGLSTGNLHVSVYHDDQESYDIWHNDMKIPAEKIHRLGASENFWQMGDTGPCGPCTEIHVDRGPGFGCEQHCSPACDCDRFLEVWNVVFMQFDRQQNGVDKPLTRTGVDTGMGLERIASVMQNKDSVFETDLFTEIVDTIQSLTGIVYAQQDAQTKAAFHVLADHIRSSTMLISDGCTPSNEGRGYVLRKIIRRAALFAQKLTDKNIFPELSKTVIAQMSEWYPDLKKNERLVFTLLTSEIEKFADNLVRGQSILETYFTENQTNKVINGAQVFKLYDTFGFPTELIKVIAHERGFTVDESGFEAHMAKQKEQSGKKVSDELAHIDFDGHCETEFTGYHELETPSTIAALVHENKSVSQVPAGSTCWVITKKSPFFIVGGGQVPDNGWLTIRDQQIPIHAVRYIGKAIAAQIRTTQALVVGDAVTSQVNAQLRTMAMKNHTATHLLQAALMEVVGKQIKQSGSLVHPDYLRFDFTYHENLTAEQIKQVEDLVNEKIMQDMSVSIKYMPMKEAVAHGALAFFGDKYNPENVRMVDVDGFSVELCGGTHVPSTGVIGVFKIIEVTALSAGHRRVIAVTGPRALELFQETFATVKKLGQDFKVQRDQVVEAVEKQTEQIKQLNTQIKALKKKVLKSNAAVWLSHMQDINGIPFLFVHGVDYTNDDVKEIDATLRAQKPGFYFIISQVDGRVIFSASIASEYADKVSMKELANVLKDQFGLRGGSTATTIVGGGATYDNNLQNVLADWIKKQ